LRKEEIDLDNTEPINTNLGSKISGHIYLVFSILFGVIGQVILKYSTINGSAGVMPSKYYFWIIFGLSVYSIGIVFWILCLRYLDLSYAYPFTGATYILILIFSYLLFRDTLNWQRITGVFLISTGVLIIPGNSYNATGR
jgi:multidrug transporter EmrE-like cation transporter